MSRGSAPPRLVVGAAGAAALVLACVLGPELLPTLPGHDPARAALLPPGTAITVVELTGGAVLASTDVVVEADTVRVDHRLHATEVARARMVSISHHRLWLGSDRYGRDVLWHLLRGGRLSLLIAGLGALLAVTLGGAVGLVAATCGRWLDTLLMRCVDALLAIPILPLMILLAALLRPSPALLVAVLGLSSWMRVARLVRGQVLSLRQRPFVVAARAAGSRWHQIWRLHYLPNMVGPVAQDTALRLCDLIIAEATLSFLGLGIPPTVPTWGPMVAEGHTVMLEGWWLNVFPGLAIAMLVISLALVGDGLQQLAGSET